MNTIKKFLALSLILSMSACDPISAMSAASADVAAQLTNNSDNTKKSSSESENKDAVTPANPAPEKIQSLSMTTRVRNIVARQMAAAKRYSNASWRHLKGAALKTKKYTIDPVTALVAKIMLSAKNRWNGFTAEQFEFMKKTQVGDVVKDYIDDKPCANKSMEALRELVRKSAWTQEDCDKATVALLELEPSVLRKAVNGAKVFINTITFGYVCKKDKKAEALMLATKVQLIKRKLEDADKADKEMPGLKKQLDELLDTMTQTEKAASLLSGANKALGKLTRQAAQEGLLAAKKPSPVAPANPEDLSGNGAVAK